jgi:hypothetical protein
MEWRGWYLLVGATNPFGAVGTHGTRREFAPFFFTGAGVESATDVAFGSICGDVVVCRVSFVVRAARGAKHLVSCKGWEGSSAGVMVTDLALEQCVWNVRYVLKGFSHDGKGVKLF